MTGIINGSRICYPQALAASLFLSKALERDDCKGVWLVCQMIDFLTHKRLIKDWVYSPVILYEKEKRKKEENY